SSSTTWTPGPSLSPGLNGANDYTIPVTPMGMTIDPGGNFLVVYTAEPDIAFLFAIAPSTGALTAEAPVPTLIDGYSLALSIGTSAPVVSAASAFAANEEAPGTISTYTILSGALTAGSTVPGVTAVQISWNRGAGVREIGAFSGLDRGLRVEVAILLSKLGAPGKRDLLGGGVELGRGLKRLIDPGEQIAVDEQLLAQQSGEIGQAPAEAGTQLQVLEQEQCDQGGPDLNLQGIGAGAD